MNATGIAAVAQRNTRTPGFGSRREMHGDWVSLRTLILLRWLAIAGQIAAILGGVLLYGIVLDLWLCFLVVGASVAANLGAIYFFSDIRRLTEAETTATLLFDTAQLALLIALTGGLNNPFALLIVAPATIAATALQPRAIVLVGAAAIAMVSLVAWFHLPLVTRAGVPIAVPPVLAFGFWLAIVTCIVFLGFYARRVAYEGYMMNDALLATQMALAREQKLTDLGGVVAAAAHELGTPLATIKLVSTELADELDDREELREDALLIRAQADRCRDILRDMGRAGKDDMHLRSAPLLTVLREAAEPHLDRGRTVHFIAAPAADPAGESLAPEAAPDGDPARQPVIYRLPELVHALRNLVQNAVDFSRTAVWVDAQWDAERITVRVSDDGPGYPSGVIGRIGDPFLSSRRTEPEQSRPGYEGMGLGLFIAKTLLERTGARLTFSNGGAGGARSGAVVDVTWPRERLLAGDGGLGENPQIV